MSANGTRATVQNAAPGGAFTMANPCQRFEGKYNVVSLATARAEYHWRIAESEWHSLYGATIADTLRALVERNRADPCNKEFEDQLDISLWRARRLAKALGVVDRLDAIIIEVNQ